MNQSQSFNARPSGTSEDRDRRRTEIRPVDPIAFAEEASVILRAAWRPPSLDYTPEYLRFQCGFPTTLDPISLAAYEGDEAVGFVAATGRGSDAGEMYLSSFLCLRPGSVSSLSIALVRQQTRMLRKAGMPSLVFAQVGSIGEYLLKCIDSLGIERVPLGEYRVHAAVPRAKATPSDLRVEQVPDGDWAADAERLRDDTLLSPAFNAANLRHFTTDPTGRKFLRVSDANGKVVAVAMQGYTRTVTATGVDQIPALHYVRLADQRPEALTALLAFAKDPAHPVVMVPNAAAISLPVAKAAGVRATGSAFAAYLCPLHHDLPRFRGTEFEIV